jgi:hypothetical protein
LCDLFVSVLTDANSKSPPTASAILIAKSDLAMRTCGRSLDSVTPSYDPDAMRQMFRLHPFLTLSFALSCLAAVAFLVDVLIGVAGWDGGKPGPVRPWMTIGLVAENWGLDPEAIDAAADLPLPVNGRPFTLQEIADARGVPVQDIVSLVERTVRHLRQADHPDGSGESLGGQTE